MSDGTEKRRIKVLVVDDSPTVRDVVHDLLSSDDQISVVGTAGDGKEAVEKVRMLQPDIVTMDLEMPKMNGFDAIEHIMAFNPVPIVVLTSSMWRRGDAYTYRALELGAVAVYAKPHNVTDLSERFVREVKTLSHATVITHVRGKRKTRAGRGTSGYSSLTYGEQVVGIVCSTGGPNALRRILASLSPDIPAGILIVQHISEGFDSELTHWLADKSAVEVRRALDGDAIRPGIAYICPAGRHTIVEEQGKIVLDDSPPVDCFRPSGDLMLKSLSKVYGAGTTGVILTGMGRDGARGMKAVREAGGRTIAQDEESSLIFGMPRAAIEMGIIDKVASLDLISEEIMESLCSSWK
jgi:two-component system chemotaxis response regulator CheB